MTPDFPSIYTYTKAVQMIQVKLASVDIRYWGKLNNLSEETLEQIMNNTLPYDLELIKDVLSKLGFAASLVMNFSESEEGEALYAIVKPLISAKRSNN